MDVIKLTDKVAPLNRDVEKLDSVLRDMDKRVVRIESAMEFSTKGNPIKVISHDEKSGN